MPAHMCRQHTRTFRCASVIDTQAEYVQAGASSFKLQDGRRPLPMKNTVTLFILTSLSYLSFTVNTCSIWNLGVLVLLIGCLLGPFIATTRCHLRTGLVAHRLATTPSIPFKVLSMSVHSLVLKLPSLMAIPVMVSFGKRSTSGICRRPISSGTTHVRSILPMVPFASESKPILRMG